MKALVVYYSRTGTTKTVGNAIAKALKCPVEELSDQKMRQGPVGYLRCCKDILLRRTVELKKIKHDPSKYDIVIIGTPVWLHQPSSLVRTYMQNYSKKFKKVAFFCTYMATGEKAIFNNMSAICDKKPVATLGLRSREVYTGAFEHKVKAFAESL